MSNKKYSARDILLYVNCYHGLLAARDHFFGGCDVMPSNSDWDNIPQVRKEVEQWEAEIPDELGDMWMERPRDIKNELLKKLDELEGTEE